MAVNIQQNLFDIIQRDPSQTEDVLLKKGGTLKVATIGNNFFQNLIRLLNFIFTHCKCKFRHFLYKQFLKSIFI